MTHPSWPSGPAAGRPGAGPLHADPAAAGPGVAPVPASLPDAGAGLGHAAGSPPGARRATAGAVDGTGEGAGPDGGGAPTDPPTAGQHRARRRVPLWAVLLLALALVASVAAGVHLLRTAQAWESRAGEYLRASQDLGGQIASTRAELAGTEAELDAVRAQLGTAQARIVELADEKAQLGDDREVQRQLVDYQARVSEAAGQVALALDQCVQGQQELIGYLQNSAAGTAQYDPLELEGFRTDVEALCQTATEANIALQRELSR